MTLRMTTEITLETREGLSIERAQYYFAPRIMEALRAIGERVQDVRVTGLEVVHPTSPTNRKAQRPPHETSPQQ